MSSAENILEHLLDAVLVVDAAGSIVYANRAAATLFQTPQEELLGAAFGSATEPGLVQEITLLRGGTVHTAEMLVSAIQWNGARASLLSLRDVTAARAATAELVRQRRDLERSNEENAQYASLASHDLREPVRKILLYSERLLASERLEPDERKKTETIFAAADRMRRLIDGIARLSKAGHDRPPFARVNLNDVLRDVRSDLELLLQEKSGRIEADPLPEIDAVPGDMYQLLLNLVANALKYSKPGTPPLLQIRETGNDPDWCCISVADNGMGFPANVGRRLFQPFQRLHGSHIEGMGVGLALCQKIVDAHHGSIQADGAEGVGATFTVRLPRRQPAAFSGAGAR